MPKVVMTDSGEAGQDVWIHRVPLEEQRLQVSNLSFFFEVSVNAHEWVTTKLTYRKEGHHGKTKVSTALPKLASFLALTSSL